MCYRSLKIINNTRYFSTTHDRVFNTVPCGCCGECLQRKQNDWMIRNYFEFRKTKDLGGFTLFVTFTYSPEYIPLLFHRDTGETIPCFNKRDVQQFFDLLRKRLSRYYHHNVRLKYFLTSEYGEKFGRSHYHALLYFHEPLQNVFRIRKEIKDCWKYGIVDFGQNFGLVKDIRAIHYVSKYVSKDLSFHDPKYKDFFDTWLLACPDTANYLRHNFFPFHVASQRLGDCITDYVSKEDLLHGKVNIPYGNQIKTFHIPLYNDRKLFYELDEYKSYKLTDEGINMRLARSKDSKELLSNYIQKLHSNLTTWVSDDVISLIRIQYPQIHSAYDIKNYFNSFFSKYSKDEFIDYLVNYRNYSYLDDISLFQFSDEVPSPFDRLNKKNTIDQLGSSLKFCDFASEPSLQRYISEYTYNNLDREMEQFAMFFDCIRFNYGKLRNHHFYEKYKQQKRIKYFKDVYT